jgi:hypothetical protein
MAIAGRDQRCENGALDSLDEIETKAASGHVRIQGLERVGRRRQQHGVHHPVPDGDVPKDHQADDADNRETGIEEAVHPFRTSRWTCSARICCTMSMRLARGFGRPLGLPDRPGWN